MNERIGIIAEYNPFHLGHAKQISILRKRYPDADILVAMSGSFVQRGTPAVVSKWQRAAWAIRHVDMVVEIPTAITLRSAAYFATGACRLLAAAGCTHLAFGAEHPDSAYLATLAAEPEPQELYLALSRGLPYHQAHLSALDTSLHPHEIGTNDILAASYLRAIQQYDLPLQPIPLPRNRSGTPDKADGVSGSAVRHALYRQLPVYGLEPTVQEDLLCNRDKGLITTPIGYEQVVLPLIRTLQKEQLEHCGEFSEGLENRFYRARHAATLESFWQEIKSKRYPHARIRRLTAQVILGITHDIFTTVDTGPHWIRPLALRADRSHLLQNTPLPVLHQVAHAMRKWDTPLANALAVDLRATDLAALATTHDKAGGKDYYQSPLIITESDI